MRTLDPKAYGRLLATELPKPIANDKEFDQMVERLEALDFPERALTPEEEALREVLAALVEVYDEEHHHIPDVRPFEVLQHLMQERDLRQVDLVPVIGTRAQLSDMVNGRRGISKAQAKKLAKFFGVSAELFI